MSDGNAAVQSIFEKASLILLKNGFVKARVVSASMEPVIMTDEQVTVVPLSNNPQRFDIIVYKGDRELICHYIWHRNQIINEGDNDLFITRGLKSKRNDYPIHRNDILGLVSSHRLSVWWKIRLMWANR